MQTVLNKLCEPYTGAFAGTPCVGRFAPSPSGRMHLGNIYAAVMSYVSARAKGGRWILRIEDIDKQRSRHEWADYVLSDLEWLGMEWDGDVEYQSARDDIYNSCLSRLDAMGLLYPCRCTRAELMASRAPHASDGHVAYSGHCRPASPCCGVASLPETLRLMVPPYIAGVDVAVDAVVPFDDRICGHREVVLKDYFGDFVLRRRDGTWAYQFAVAVDDAMMGVTEVVRGDDLLMSTAPQRYVASLLGLVSPHTYAHLPLLKNEHGERLSKRDGAVSMEWLRSYSSSRDVVAMVARSAGVEPDAVLKYF